MQDVASNVLSERVLNMNESATLMMTKLARELRDKGNDVISLSIGEPDFDTPEHIKEFAKKALDDGYTKYTPVNGLPELREAISTKFKRDNNLDYSSSQIVVSNGAKQSIYNICMAMLNPGDEVLIFSPYWVSYYDIVKLAEGVPAPLYAGIESDFKVTAEQVASAINEKTKLILFSSPCNPTGSVFTHKELEAIAKVIGQHKDIYIISDEIYEFINFTGQHVSIGSFDSVKDQTITVNGMAKGFAMTGWRIGYMGAPQFIANACTKIQGQVTSGATAFGQKATAQALLGKMEPTHAMCEKFLERRDMIIGLLENIEGFKVNRPTGAFYSFPNIAAYFNKSNGDNIIKNSDDFAMYLLGEAHVAVVSGAAFGADECIRISYAASEEQLREAVRRIKAACEKLV